MHHCNMLGLLSKAVYMQLHSHNCACSKTVARAATDYSPQPTQQQQKDRVEHYSTQGSRAITQPSISRAQSSLTALIGREGVCSGWYGRSILHNLFHDDNSAHKLGSYQHHRLQAAGLDTTAYSSSLHSLKHHASPVFAF